jgi:short-subunit dehydrogenase
VVARAWPADLAHDAGITALAAELARQPRVDVLVNNAGFGTLGPLARTDPDAQSRMVHLHCVAPLRLAQAVLPGMVQRRAGLVINVASVAAFMTAPGNGTYSATKAFLRVLTDGMAAELAGTGVRVQALCPGFTRTEFHQRMNFSAAEIPAPLWMSADAVVDASLAAADRGGPVTVVPGMTYKAVVALFRLLPLRVASAMQRLAPRRGPITAPE